MRAQGWQKPKRPHLLPFVLPPPIWHHTKSTIKPISGHLPRNYALLILIDRHTVLLRWRDTPRLSEGKTGAAEIAEISAMATTLGPLTHAHSAKAISTKAINSIHILYQNQVSFYLKKNLPNHNTVWHSCAIKLNEPLQCMKTEKDPTMKENHFVNAFTLMGILFRRDWLCHWGNKKNKYPSTVMREMRNEDNSYSVDKGRLTPWSWRKTRR